MANIPSALRVGSPEAERGKNPFLEGNVPSESTSAASQDRLSTLFPDRHPSNASDRSQKRYSFPISLPSREVPREVPTFTTPKPPAPPTFYSTPSHDSVPDNPAQTYVQPSYRPSRHVSLLSKLGSIKSLGTTRRSRYGRLEDAEETEGLKTSQARLKEVEEEEDDDDDDEEGIGYDLSAFEGPIALRTMASRRENPLDAQVLPGRSENLQPTEIYNSLGQRERQSMLGGGMSEVIERPEIPRTEQAATPVRSPTRRFTIHRRIPSTGKPQYEEAQRAAEKTGEIVAVTEAPAVDISNLDGAEYDNRSVLNNVPGESTKSYYFPPDPDMPDWKPLSMSWWYISILVSIALTLGVIQEYLCQLSIRKAKENDGLLKFTSPQHLTMVEYFTWKYAPTIILLSYGILWQISDFEVKRLEPYYQLSRPTGATAAESLNIDYLTFLSYLIPLKALRYRQWAVLYSSLGTLIAGSLVPILQSASVVMLPPQAERHENDWKYVRIDPRWSRPMSASLFCVALCGILLLFKLRRKSGLLSDPKGIAGIAAMATRSHILQDFHGLDIAPENVIHKQLARRRYILHKSSLWQGEYIRNNHEDYETQKGDNPLPLMMTLKAGIPYIIIMITFMVLLPIFLFQPQANVVTEKLPFLLTTIATIIKLLWGTLDCDIRMIEPFYVLSRRNAPPRTLTLDYTGTIPGYLSIKAALNGHYLVALVGCGAIMTEVLTVCVSSFSVDGKRFFPGSGHGDDNDDNDADDQSTSRYNSDETFKSFWVSFGLAIGILIFLCAVAATVYARRRHKFTPRQPGTIAAVLAFIHQSRMLLTFVDTQRMNSKQMTRWLEDMPKTYALGWFRGRDGADHCGIDEEPILAEYKHGHDWRKGRLQAGQVGTWEQY